MNIFEILVKRVFATLVLLIGISIVSFTIIVAVPGDYVDSWITQTMAMTGQSYNELLPQAEKLRTKLGLDQPVAVQYLHWVSNIVFHGDFGMSFAHNRPVTEVIGLRLPRSIGLSITTLILGKLIGIGLGVYAAVNQHKLGDTVTTVIAFLGIVIPKFVLSLIILYVLAFIWHSPYIGSLYSPEYILQDEFSFGKLWDFLLHTW